MRNWRKHSLNEAINKQIQTFRKVIEGNCSFLKINNKLKLLFEGKPKVHRKHKPILIEGYCEPPFWKINSLSCKQVVPTTIFKSNAIRKIYLIFHQLNRKSSRVIYLVECSKCKIKYIRKSGTHFDKKLSNRRKDITRNDSTPASNQYFKNDLLLEMLHTKSLNKELSIEQNTVLFYLIFSTFTQ